MHREQVSKDASLDGAQEPLCFLRSLTDRSRRCISTNLFQQSSFGSSFQFLPNVDEEDQLNSHPEKVASFSLISAKTVLY